MAVAELTSLLTGIKGTITVANGLKSAYDSHTIVQAQTDILERLVALQMDALTLQEKHSALIQEKDDLTKKMMEFVQWEKTEGQYELKETDPGTFVYAYKKNNENIEPMHWLCPKCWQDGKKSILQTYGSGRYGCPKCEKSFRIFPYVPDQPERRRGFQL